jgi:phosphoribosyl 1,2-cyclic phosphodiesterase
MKVTFWGVRGSYPVAADYCVRYGGNTPCLEVETGGTTLLVDAGTGIYAAGKSLQERKISVIHLLVSHTHWDHIQGFPHFGLLHDSAVEIYVYALRRSQKDLREIFSAQQDTPFFPLPLDQVKARLEFIELNDGETFQAGTARVTCKRLNHPGVAGGFRVENGKSVFSYISDADLYTDHLLGEEMPVDDPEKSARIEELRSGARDLAHSSDLMVCDTYFRTDEYRPDFGHSTPEDALRLGAEAAAKRIAFLHHRPDRSDDSIDEIVARYQAESPNATELLAAKEGLELSL